MNPDQILIYSGPGASSLSIENTKSTLSSLLDPRYSIYEIYPHHLRQNQWHTGCALFVMPGGADRFYQESLRPQGNDSIRKYVEEGGAYLGICAGAYYAAERIIFALQTPLEIREDRDLGFFKGTVEGPLLADYDYDSNSGARVAYLEWQAGPPFKHGSQFAIFYNGGGYFVPNASAPHPIILGHYITEGELKPAIIETCVGKGKALLSGIHWEYNPHHLDRTDPHLKGIIPQLEKAYPQTLELSQHLLERLGLKTRRF